jgi:hypothetical protein
LSCQETGAGCQVDELLRAEPQVIDSGHDEEVSVSMVSTSKRRVRLLDAARLAHEQLHA